MSGMLAVLVYLLAMGLPLYLLFQFHSQAWYWHALALVAAIGLGFVPLPAQMQSPVFDLFFGFAFIVLLIWGVCGLLLSHAQHNRHRHTHA